MSNPEELIGDNLFPGNISFTVGKISTILLKPRVICYQSGQAVKC